MASRKAFPLPLWLTPVRLAAAVFVIALAVYLRTVAPTVTSEDSGELITAVKTLGVAHPPGYPLYCILSRAFLLLPLESVALRINIASALFTAAAAGLLVPVALRVGAAWPFAAAAALTWAFARDVWAQAVVAEVYALNALLLSATILFLLRWSEGQRPRDLYGAALAFGLSLANHYPLALLAAPATATFAVRTARRAGIRGTVWLRAALLPVGCLLIYAYLPVASSFDPPINWGDPSTPSRFVAHVSRMDYKHVEFAQAGSLETKARFGGLFLRLLAEQWTAPALLLFGVLGIHRLRNRTAARDLFLGIAVTTALGLIVIPSYSFEHLNIQRFDELYMPVYLSLAPVLACGLAEAAGTGTRRFRGAGRSARLSQGVARATTVLCSGIFLLPLALHFRDCDLSGHRLSEDYNRYVLESLPKNAVYFTSGDYTSFPTLYLQVVEGVRGDVLLANVTGEVSPEARSYLSTIAPDVDASQPAALQDALVRRGGRPVFVASKADLRIPAKVRPYGLVYRVMSESDASAVLPPDLLAADLQIPRSVPAADGLGNSLVSDYLLMRGEALFERGEMTEARASLLAAADVLPESKEALNNIGSTLAERGLAADAERMFHAAASLSPTYVMPRRNLAKLLVSLGRREEAISAYQDLLRVAPGDAGARAALDALLSWRDQAGTPHAERIAATLRAIDQDPTNPALYNNLGNMYAESRDGPRAREAFERALAINPSYALAYKNLALLYRDVFADSIAAERYEQKYHDLGGE